MLFLMFKILKDINFIYQEKVEKLSAGEFYSQQELVDRLCEFNFLSCKKQGYFQEQTLDNEPQEIQETEYRFEVSGYKQKDGSAFKKGKKYTETEIKEAGLDIEELLNKEAITWLK